LRLFLTFSLLLLSCSEVAPSADEDLQESRLSELFICHNPDSEDHNKLCTPGCLEPSENGSPFCWLLEKKDCTSPPDLEWEKEFCHLFD